MTHDRNHIDAVPDSLYYPLNFIVTMCMQFNSCIMQVTDVVERGLCTCTCNTSMNY